MVNPGRQNIIGYGQLTLVWLGLILLTALTVWVSRLPLAFGHVWIALAIATLKGGLVIAYFMHLRYEGRLLCWLLFIVLVLLALFIGLTFFDVLYR